MIIDGSARSAKPRAQIRRRPACVRRGPMLLPLLCALVLATTIPLPCCLAVPFDGIGTLCGCSPSFYGDQFYWDGGVLYYPNHVGSFSVGDRVHITGDLVDHLIYVASIEEAGPFQECGRLETSALCPYLVYCGKYDQFYRIDTFGGFGLGDSVLVGLDLQSSFPAGDCQLFPWWAVASLTPCGAPTPSAPATWGFIRMRYR
jgi:hypothetical protein